MTSAPEAPSLTPRQRAIVAALLEDARYASVARVVGISVHTVRAHVRIIAMQLEGSDAPLYRVLKHGARLLSSSPSAPTS